MFNWLWAWFASDDAYNVYRRKERQLFSYWNGARMVHADPIALYRRMMKHGPELAIDIRVALSPSKDAGPTSAKISEKIRDIFQLLPLTNEIEPDGTLDENQCADLLRTFLTYCGSVKKNSSTTATSVATTSPATPKPTVADVDPATPSTSDSGSAVNGTTTAPPEPLPTGSESHSG